MAFPIPGMPTEYDQHRDSKSAVSLSQAATGFLGNGTKESPEVAGLTG